MVHTLERGSHGARTKARLLLVPAVLLVAACTPFDAGIMAGTTVISLLETDKTPTDHILSQVMNKDCSSKRLLEGADHMCLDENANASKTVAQAAPSYCYRTLGNVTCYTEPNPFGSNASQVAWPVVSEPESTASLALRDTENKGN